MHTITAHIVVRDAGAAATWYAEALGAEEQGRIEVPGGKFMQIELSFGDSTVMLADEFPELGVLSPLAIGGTATVLHLRADDVDAAWQRAPRVRRRVAALGHLLHRGGARLAAGLGRPGRGAAAEGAGAAAARGIG